MNDLIIPVKTGPLQLSKISLPEDYRKEWNVDMDDFVCLTMNGKLISDSLYRVGGLSNPNIGKNKYFMLIKYIHAYYSDEILQKSGSHFSKRKHLEGRWCILDNNGVEQVIFTAHKFPYLVDNSCIYTLDRKYYNIETGEFYCQAYTTMETNEFLFLENAFDKDVSRRGVMKIDKKTGTWELFPNN